MFIRPVKGVLFDMDGLLIDTEAVYIEALQAAARAMGREMPLAFCHSMIGIPGPICDGMISDFYGPGFSLDVFSTHFDAHARRAFEAGVPVKSGAVELLDFLRDRGLPLAIATSSSRATVARHLGRAGLLDRFKAIATRDDVISSKPHPDVYFEAARQLGIPAESCIALEDSNVGLAAAHAAGTMAIMVPDILTPTDESRAKCLHVAEDLASVLHLLRSTLAP
ncbi:haloacid dehalogenase superfamily, subfamily IA, variant 3 with third motif having DD or ED [Enhydrobacter aerosaccus]|uniref:Haloacid dehalogenase superfamily, subfamily IA, variant 3 with third motif having DD or ED n=1 Tax=Enhydrobacter aerosaccus TaxID=225324 RepID=A0A1T4P300_9HYPH|nr:HAD family phosphatase [Enhydrobacter aerosaccus]SJZ85883.1 haloacid dehalogenase superfamily, subfamily IA, variant 3 with third motif having DD or ED [Enhydrobacter aerosaccus]